MATLITGAGMIGSLAAARIVSERGERPVLYDIAFSERNLAERLDGGSVDLVKGDIGDLLRTIESHGVERIIHTASLLTRDLIPRPGPALGRRRGGDGRHAERHREGQQAPEHEGPAPADGEADRGHGQPTQQRRGRDARLLDAESQALAPARHPRAT